MYALPAHDAPRHTRQMFSDDVPGGSTLPDVDELNQAISDANAAAEVMSERIRSAILDAQSGMQSMLDAIADRQAMMGGAGSASVPSFDRQSAVGKLLAFLEAIDFPVDYAP